MFDTIAGASLMCIPLTRHRGPSSRSRRPLGLAPSMHTHPSWPSQLLHLPPQSRASGLGLEPDLGAGLRSFPSRHGHPPVLTASGFLLTITRPSMLGFPSRRVQLLLSAHLAKRSYVAWQIEGCWLCFLAWGWLMEKKEFEWPRKRIIPLSLTPGEDVVVDEEYNTSR